MPLTDDLSKLARSANGIYNSITANATAITSMSVGGATINATSFGGTANNANNLGGVATASYVNTSGAYTITGIHTHQANIQMGNTSVNTQISNSTILISNSTSTSTLGLTDLRIGNATVNSVISTTTSTFSGNVGIGTSTPGAMLAVTGSSTTLSTLLTNIAEPATISATAATGTINYDITTQSVLYYTSNASANWTVNFRGSAGTSSNTLLATGQSITAVFLVTQGATAYYNNVVQVDGTSVTPKYQGGTAWTAGNANSIDIYTYTIMKTGSAAFSVFASQTQFK
jgi:hypothetical protein